MREEKLLHHFLIEMQFLSQNAGAGRKANTPFSKYNTIPIPKCWRFELRATVQSSKRDATPSA